MTNSILQDIPNVTVITCDSHEIGPFASQAFREHWSKQPVGDAELSLRVPQYRKPICQHVSS